MDIAVKEAVVDELTFLVNGGQPNVPHAGICWIIQHVISQICPDGAYVDNYTDWSGIKTQVYNDWNKWTGSDCYPVPLSSESAGVEAAAEAFDACENKWDRTTEYGMLRLELVGLLLDAVIDSPTNSDCIHSIHNPCERGKV
jgi:hypothetical protein